MGVKNSFYKEAMVEGRNPKWESAIKRTGDIYKRDDDIRDDFERDYCRILHSTGYRRLKHKTQVFFATEHDHICTRMEHVSHVMSVSHTIAKFLSLNLDLVWAIAIGHDIGHAPFGHAGEEVLKKIAKKERLPDFWHEKNSLRFLDYIELLESPEGTMGNQLLSYAVRDGIICHCGEANENEIRPREEVIDLEKIKKANQVAPYSWEGCVVKVADKISYLGRDIEDAEKLGVLTQEDRRELLDILKIVKGHGIVKEGWLNNTILLHKLIIDLCKESSPETGIKFSNDFLNLMRDINKFNKNKIYDHPRIQNYKNYASLIITSIFKLIAECHKGDTFLSEVGKLEDIYPLLGKTFMVWLFRYSNARKKGDLIKNFSDKIRKDKSKFHNKTIYDIGKRKDCMMAILDYISSMTDNFAIRIFGEMTSFK